MSSASSGSGTRRRMKFRSRERSRLTTRDICWSWSSAIRRLAASSTYVGRRIACANIVSLAVEPVDGASAGVRAARARHLFDILREVVIHGQFLAGTDIALRVVQDVALNDSSHDVRTAGVVDILRAAAADRTVQGPVLIQGEQ